MNRQPLLHQPAYVVALLLLLLGCEPRQTEQPFLLGLGYGFHNATIVVEDLEASTAFYRDTLGFQIREEPEPGYRQGTLSLSFSFADVSAIELLAFDDSTAQDTAEMVLSENYEGIRWYAVSSSAVDSTARWLDSQDYPVDSVMPLRTDAAPEGWDWDDGGPDLLSLSYTPPSPQFLPVFIEQSDYNYQQASEQWRSYYSYERRYSEHPNKVVGIKAIRMVVEELDEASLSLQKMGFTQTTATDSIVVFNVYKEQEIHLLSSRSRADLGEFHAQNGDAIYAIRFDVSNLDSTRTYLAANALSLNRHQEEGQEILSLKQRNLQLEFVQESEAQAILAKTLRPNDKLDSAGLVHGANIYAKYCALCHADDRSGYAADHAPSLRSKSLLATSMNTNFIRYTIHHGRANTAMGGYLDQRGGPLEYIDIEILIQWLYERAEVEEPLVLPREAITGNVEEGGVLYQQNCATCHGTDGEGVTAPALGHPMLLATATDHFLKYAIEEGREGTPMIGFKETLTSEEIDDVVAFLRSRASGWSVPKKDTVTIPSPDAYVLNPDNNDPSFELRNDRYVSAAAVNTALEDSLRMVILDARSEVAWRQMHIPGSIPVPYYEDPENFVNDLPNDSTQIVIYCACPHAASERVQKTLVRYGFKNTAIIDEGILVWAQMGFPVQNGN